MFRGGGVVDIGRGANHPRLEVMDRVRFHGRTFIQGPHSDFDGSLASAGFQYGSRGLDWRPQRSGSVAFCGSTDFGTHRRLVRGFADVGEWRKREPKSDSHGRNGLHNA